MLQEEIRFRGHPNVLSLHTRTLEITREEHLTLRGDCIIGVSADKACADLADNVRARLQSPDSVVRIEILVAGQSFSVQGQGDPRLSLQNKHDIVVRKTRFVCPRTLAVGSDSASSDLPREMVRLLQDKDAVGIFRLSVE